MFKETDCCAYCVYLRFNTDEEKYKCTRDVDDDTVYISDIKQTWCPHCKNY